jgi:hypothetical protein
VGGAKVRTIVVKGRETDEKPRTRWHANRIRFADLIGYGEVSVLRAPFHNVRRLTIRENVSFGTLHFSIHSRARKVSEFRNKP